MDATGSVIAGAKVATVNVATGVTNNATTNGTGMYYIQYLRIGSYKITFSAPGFNAQVVGPFALEINQIAKIDGKLNVGEASEVITVTGTLAPILNTENATIASTITANTISNVPLNGQNFMSLTAYLPGSVNTEPAASSGTNGSERYTSDESVPSFNGSRQMSNNFILDGVEINETLNNTAAYNPNPDAMDQVKVITANASAEFGNANGGHVLAVTKGGTNKYHGSANAYLENYNLDANTWANKDFVSPSEIIARSQYTQALFNGTFGGPIKKDKLFFFVDYEGMRYHTGGVSSASVAPKGWETGDFSDVLSVKGIQLYDSQNNFKPYANNQLPTTIASPAARFLLTHRTGTTAYYPEPNVTAVDGVALNNYQGSFKRFNRNDQGDVRIDWNVRAGDTVYGRFSSGNASDGTTKAIMPIDFPVTNNYPFNGGVISWAHVFSQSLVNELRAGFSRSIYNEANTTDPTGAFGLKGNATMGIMGIPGGQTQVGFSNLAFGDLVDGVGSAGLINNFHDNNFIYSDNLNWQKGHHMVKAGVEFIRYQQNFKYAGDSGSLGTINYTGAFTGAAGSNGTSFADFYMDRASEAQVGTVKGFMGQRQWRDGVYVQDDWKVDSKMTLNLGVRWEFFQPIYEVNNKEMNIDPDTMTRVFADKNGNSRALYDPTFTNFEPRFGFAYQADQRFVVRGGYGVTNYLEGTGTNLRLTQNYPYNSSYNLTATTPSVGSGGAPILVESAFGGNSPIPPSSTTMFFAWDKHLKPSTTQQYNLTAEYQLSNNSSISAGYVGQTGRHLIVPIFSNQWRVIGDPTTAPYQNLVGADGQKIGPNGGVKTTASSSIMNYNALQASFRHRATHGLEYTVNYTYGKALTDYAGFYGALGVSGPANYQQNPYDPHADYGPAYTDIRQSLNGTGVYELPFGRGKTFGANSNLLMDEIVSGWKVGTSGNFFSGLPVDVRDGWGPVNANAILWAQHANQYRKLKIVHRTESLWFGDDPSATPCSGADNNVCAYGRELASGYGTAGSDTERAPGYRQVDFSLFKAFSLPAGEKMEFRADSFNALNMTSMGNPSSVAAWGTFGQITSTRSPQRQIQFAMKYIF
jgi:hypothetical protein